MKPGTQGELREKNQVKSLKPGKPEKTGETRRIRGNLEK